MVKSFIKNSILQSYFRTAKTKLLLKGSLGSFSLRAVSYIIRFASAMVITNLLGASDYGIYALAIGWLSFITTPATLGFDHVMLRFVSQFREKCEWGQLKGILKFSTNTLLYFGIFVTLLSLMSVFIFYRNVPNYRTVFLFTMIVIPLVILGNTRQAIFRSFDKPVLAQFAENIVYPLSLILFIGATYYFYHTVHLQQVALYNSLSWILAFCVGTFLVFKHLPAHLKSIVPITHKKAWLGELPPYIFIGFVFQLIDRGGIIILGAMATSHDVGLFQVAMRVAELMLFIYEALTIAGTSLFSGIFASGDKVELQKFTTLATRTILFATLPVYLIFMIFMPKILVFFGSEFIYAKTLARILTTGFFISSLGGFVIVMLYMTGAQRIVAKIMFRCGLLNVMLGIVLIYYFGSLGAAISHFICLILLKYWLVYVLYKEENILSFPFDFRNIFKR